MTRFLARIDILYVHDIGAYRHDAEANAALMKTLRESGNRALEIGPVPINVTGRPMTATGINGQIPVPILRWREGDTVTLAVTNRLSAPTSIHWHGVRVPSPMDGVPGLSFHGIPPGETLALPYHHAQIHGAATIRSPLS